MRVPLKEDWLTVEGECPSGVNGGWCARCSRTHVLPAEPVIDDCLRLMEHLRQQGRIDGLIPGEHVDPRCATDTLFGDDGGKMFGLLACRSGNGQRVVLRAFSGQFNGLWGVPGWVGPIFDAAEFAELVSGPEQEIKRLGRELQHLRDDDCRYRSLRRQRRQMSRDLMAKIHDLYTLVNFRGASVPLTRAFLGDRVPPTGTGDCCGPKLLHHAVRHGLRPEAMAEFYWGRANGSGAKEHGRFYPPCEARCRPILGFQLCGL